MVQEASSPPCVSQEIYIVILTCRGRRCPAPAPPYCRASSHPRLPPQPLKPCRIGGRVHDGVLNVPVSQVVLYQPRIGSLVGEGKAAPMAQHVWVSVNR